MSLFFVTHNKHKFEEAKSIANELGINLEWYPLEYDEIQHNNLSIIAYKSCETLLQNQELKNKKFFLEDAGLFIKYLNGFPGPFSSYVFKTIGNDGILKLMEDINERDAYFLSVVAYYDGEKINLFEGRTEGFIVKTKRGEKGFGFDPIFVPYEVYKNGQELTYAEMSLETKNLYSHRQKSLRKLFKTLKRLRQ